MRCHWYWLWSQLQKLRHKPRKQNKVHKMNGFGNHEIIESPALVCTIDDGGSLVSRNRNQVLGTLWTDGDLCWGAEDQCAESIDISWERVGFHLESGMAEIRRKVDILLSYFLFISVLVYRPTTIPETAFLQPITGSKSQAHARKQ